MSGLIKVAFFCAVAGLLAVQTSGEAAVCCGINGDLGCYGIQGEFYDFVNRPINLPPICGIVPDKVALKLSTIRNPLQTETLNPYNTETIKSSKFNGKKMTKILIHGFIDKYNRAPWEAVKTALLAEGDYNVIRVDWSRSNIAPYVQACGNLRLVGAYVAKFIDHVIKNYGVNPKDVHIIGHSLGAHGAGYAGAIMQEKYNATIGRITGLDPAGPYFTNMPYSVRLDPSDAEIVDTLVTNGDVLMAFGSPQPMGDLNFYPNGGLNQPGCNKAVFSSLAHVQEIVQIRVPERTVRSAVEQEEGGVVNASVSVALNADSPAIAPTITIPVGVVATMADEQNFLSAPVPNPLVPKTPFDQAYDFAYKEAAKLAGDGRDLSVSIIPGSIGSALTNFIPVSRAVVLTNIDVFGCSHNRAVLLYAATVSKANCVMRAYQCDSYDRFTSPGGYCATCNASNPNRGCSPIGFNADLSLVDKEVQKKFFTVTTAETPYCSKLTLQYTLAPNSDAKVGRVFITLYGARLHEKLSLTHDVIDLQPGKSYSYFPELSKDLGPIKSVVFRWEVKSNLLPNPLNLFRTDSIILDPKIMLVDKEKTTHVFTLTKTKLDHGTDYAARLTGSYEN
ncbi:putative Pancreatic triacylglycerol lipase [Hypsibius exemplaris]|uniref:Pancreatic triacylglycerol lipase n=1 Tax=Hypsibius exemplaris TaxID=2072580 RepID=A0A1W0XC26_HYPEX|nr:putative Pancreatic triacylglycerol lipase [Hypsibius exemplaris]